MTESSLDRDPLDVLAEDFVARYRAGERPSLTEFAAQLPGREDEVRELFPALVAMEQLKPDSTDGQMTPAAGRDPTQVGEFRILRRVGTGGMGVVYEAVQESLGRHVALKLLPLDALADPKRLERFRREAKAAARLHHTNIVPVFGTGEADGRHFYAMQFIAGHPLDAVIDEVRRMRGKPVDGPAAAAASEVAAALVTGTFPPRSRPSDLAGTATVTLAGPASSPPLAPPPESAMGVSSTLSEGSRHYGATVARIGAQVADALAYAHGQGILHRDIKPANLLLDLQGTVWVTDFGLAKSTEADDLTQVGDVIGTIRYMGPERFDGAGDHRADIYALGLTLYELLTLTPAFTAKSRPKLIEQVVAANPPTPRSIEPEIPRDLETIVMKAIARDPAMRYQSATALAEDLRRYVEDRPIKARRASLREQAWRWCRRNPAVASLMAAVLLVLAAGTIVSTYYGTAARREAAGAIQSRNEAIEARKEGDRKLFTAYLSDANATRVGGQPGRRFDALDKVREALALRERIELTPDDLLAARNAAAAALCLADLAPGQSWRPDAPPERLAPEMRTYLRGRTFASTTPGKFDTGTSSPDGRFALVGKRPLQVQYDNPFEVWRVDGDAPVRVEMEPDTFHEFAYAFSHDSERLAVGRKDGTVSVYATADGRRLARFAGGSGLMWRLAWHPDNVKLAVIGGGSPKIWNTAADPPTVWATLPHANTAGHVFFHPNGKMVGTTGDDGFVRLWEAPEARALGAWKAFRNGGQWGTFNLVGDWMLTTDWSGQVRLWDGAIGRELANVVASMPTPARFMQDDAHFGHLYRGDEFYTLQVAAGRELRVLNRPTSDGFEPSNGMFALHPGGRLFAMATQGGLAFVDLYTGRTSVTAPVSPKAYAIRFDRDGALWTVSGPDATGAARLLRWPVVAESTAAHRLCIGPPEVVTTEIYEGWSISDDGRVAAVARGDHGVKVIQRGPSTKARLMGPHTDVRFTTISPDGRLAGTASYHQRAPDPRVMVWETATGRLRAKLPISQAVSVTRFSRDGRWVFTSGGDTVANRKWDLNEVDANLLPNWEAAPDGLASPDERLLAAPAGGGMILLLDADSGREVVRLPFPDPLGYGAISWSPDGARLFAVGKDDQKLYAFDLRRIRSGLAELNLDWDQPDYPPIPSIETDPLAPPLEVTIVGAEATASPEALTKSERQRAVLDLFQNPLDADAHYRLGTAMVEARRWSEAYAHLTTALALAPATTAALYPRSLAAFRLGKRAEAVASLDRWLAESPNDYNAVQMRALCHQRLGHQPEAIADNARLVEWYTRLIGFFPFDGDLYNARAACYDVLGDAAKATADRTAAIERGRDNPEALNKLAWRLVTGPQELRNTKRALQLITDAVAKMPTNHNFLNTLGVAQYHNGLYREAIATLEKSLSLGKGEADAFDLYFLAMCHAKLGDQAKARECFAQAVDWSEKKGSALAPRFVAELRQFREEARGLVK